MSIYRTERRERGHGMWYEPDDIYNPFTKTLAEGISVDIWRELGAGER